MNFHGLWQLIIKKITVPIKPFKETNREKAKSVVASGIPTTELLPKRPDTPIFIRAISN